MNASEGQPLFEHLALIGLGLIGSSISHAARRGHVVARITGHARTKETRDKALELGLVDAVFDTPAAAVAGADLVIIGTPVGVAGAVAEAMAPGLRKGAIVTDVGSVKGAVIRDVGPHVPEDVIFVPGHPVAGTEQSGPESGFAELFDNRWVILTPIEGRPGNDAGLAGLTAFWQALGAKIDVMNDAHHDLVLAITSHVPHLIAYNIVGTAADLSTVTNSEVTQYSAGGFRDFTRIAASDPVMWRDVFLNNREAVLEMLGRFVEDLTALQRAIRYGDGELLFDHFSRTREIRRRIIEAGQETDAPDFGRRPHSPSKE